MNAYSNVTQKTRRRVDGARIVPSPAEVKASFREKTRPYWAELSSQLECIKTLRASPPPADRSDANYCDTVTLGTWTSPTVTVANRALDYPTWGTTAELQTFFDAAIDRVPRNACTNSYEGQQFVAARSLLNLDPSPERTAVWSYIFGSSAHKFSRKMKKVDAERRAIRETLATITTYGQIPETVWRKADPQA